MFCCCPIKLLRYQVIFFKAVNKSMTINPPPRSPGCRKFPGCFFPFSTPGGNPGVWEHRARSQGLGTGVLLGATTSIKSSPPCCQQSPRWVAALCLQAEMLRAPPRDQLLPLSTGTRSTSHKWPPFFKKIPSEISS